MLSVFISAEPASLVFADLEGNVVEQVDRASLAESSFVEWRGLAPAPRSVKNVDVAPMRALRIEIEN